MNDNEAARIASAINCLRPDWPTASLKTLITTRLGNRSRRDVAVALTWVACESNTEKPARVLEAGPWWKAASVETPEFGARRPPLPDEECKTHLGQYAEHCGGCYADKRAAQDEADEVRGRTAREEALAAARAAVHEARGDLCGHHLQPDTCRLCRTPTPVRPQVGAQTKEPTDA